MRIALPLLLISLAGLAVWAFAVRSPAEPTAPVTVDTGPDQEAAPPAAATAQTERAPLESAADAPTVTPPDARTVELLVVRHGTGAPIAGAEVGYLTTEQRMRTRDPADAAALQRGDPDFFRRHGSVEKTDASGKCRLPTGERGVSVHAVFEDLYGAAYLRADSTEPHVLALRADRRLTVHVRGASGRPAGRVQVMLQRKTDGATRRTMRFGLGWTDAAGELRVPHAQKHAGDGPTCTAQVWAEGTGVESDRVEIDLLDRREATIELKMAPAGSISFALVREDGSAFDLSGFETPRVSMQMFDEKPTAQQAFRARQLSAEFDADGRARVEHIGFDRFYAATVISFVRTPLIGRGPTPDRPDLVVPVRISDQLIVLRGRALSADASPLAEQRVAITCRHARGQAGQVTHTDADGWFAAPMPYLDAGTEVDISLRSIGQPASSTGLTAKMPGSWNLRPGSNDLGDVRFGTATLLLSGRLVVPDALASLQQIQWQCEAKTERRWEQLPGVQTRWLEERRFEVRGVVPQQTGLRLRFSKGTFLPLEPLEFAPGTEGVEIRLSTAGSVEASFLVDDPATADLLRLRLDSSRSREQPDFRERMERDAMARFRLRPDGAGRLVARWNGLESGSYVLAVECPGAHEPLARFEGIVVEDGPVEDRRLVDIDLRGLLRLVEIRVEDPQGEPVTSAKAMVLVADAGGDNWYGHRVQQGRTRVLISRSADVRAMVPGYPSKVAPSVTGDHVIRLEPPREVRVRVEWPFDLPEGITPQVQLMPSVPGTTRSTRVHYPGGSSGLENLAHADGFVGDDGVAVVRPMFTGVQRVRIAMDPHGRGHYFYAITPRTITLDGGEPGEVVLQADEASLRETLARIKR